LTSSGNHKAELPYSGNFNYTSPVLPLSAKANVSTDALEPGARVVWCLKRRATDVRCLVLAEGVPVEVRVLHDTDVVLTEIFQEEWMALSWARAYRERLRAQGWNDVPDRPPPGDRQPKS
jgi:hypothetical protein